MAYFLPPYESKPIDPYTPFDYSGGTINTPGTPEILNFPSARSKYDFSGIAGQTAMLPDNMLQTMTDAYGGGNPQQDYMENIPAFGYDRGWEGPIGSTGLHNRRPSVQYQEQSFHPETWEGRNLSTEEQQDPFWSTEREYNPMLQKALISQNRENLYGQTNMQQDYRRPPLNQTNMAGIPAVQDFSFSEYQGPSQEAEGITAANEAQGKGNFLTNLLDNTFLGKMAAMRNPLNKRSGNYNPALQGQIDFMEGDPFGQGSAYGVMDQSGLNKITGGTLAGKNLVSGFGTNDLQQMYEDQIGKYEKTYENLDKQWGNTLDDEEMALKKQAYFNKFLNPAKRQHQQLLEHMQLEEKKKADAAAATATAPAYQGPKTYDFDPGQFQREGRRPDKPGGFTDPGKGSYGPHKAQGGYMRRGYSRGGRVGILSVF